MPEYAAATVHEAGGQIGALPREIRPLRPGVRVQGPAYTVLCGPRDNLALHHAIANAPAGAVIVCHVAGYHDAGYIGDVMVTAAEVRGIAGFVIDGCVRDSAVISVGPVAVFARGLSIRGTTKDPLLPMGVQSRLRIGDVDVDPGDLVIGDDDGVVVVPAARSDEVLHKADLRESQESDIRARLRAGEVTTGIYALPPLPGQGTARG